MAFTLMAEGRRQRDATSAPQFWDSHGRPHPCRRRRSDSAPPPGGDDEAVRLRRGDGGVGRGGAGADPGARPSAGQSRHSRPRHARSRRHGRARTPAPARHRRAGDRADGARLDRGRHLGDAGRRDRLRRQAGRGRAAAVFDQERAPGRRAGRRASPRHPAQRRRARLSRHRQPRGLDGAARCGLPSAPPSPTFPC